MTLLIAWLRYGLIIFPAIGSALLSTIPSHGLYTFYLLLFLWFAQIRDKWLLNRSPLLYIVIETAFAGWLCYLFSDGVLYLLIFSTLLSCFPLKNNHLRMLVPLIQSVVLIGSVWNQGTSMMLVTTMLYAACAILLFHGQSVSSGKVEVEQVYNQLRQKHYELEEARVRVVEYAKKVGDLAQIEERNRISGDIHDELGHKLIRLKMMMEAVIRIMDSQPEKGMEMIRQVRDQLTDSMETLRTTVRRLKPTEETSKKYTLTSLIDDLASNSSITVSFHSIGRPYPLYPSEEIVLYRNAQEAVTNAMRHGQASTVHIELSYGYKELVMQISNNGTVPEFLSPMGVGMKGMEERTQLLGGQLLVERGEQYTITTILPRHQIE